MVHQTCFLLFVVLFVSLALSRSALGISFDTVVVFYNHVLASGIFHGTTQIACGDVLLVRQSFFFLFGLLVLPRSVLGIAFDIVVVASDHVVASDISLGTFPDVCEGLLFVRHDCFFLFVVLFVRHDYFFLFVVLFVPFVRPRSVLGIAFDIVVVAFDHVVVPGISLGTALNAHEALLLNF